MKILIVAQNFQMGGIQRALINMLNIMNDIPGWDIDLFTFGEGPLIGAVPQSIRIIRGKRSLKLAATPFSKVMDEPSICNKMLRMYLMLKVRLIGAERLYNYLFLKQEKLQEYDVAISYFNDVPNNYFNRGANQYVDKFVNAKRKIAWIHNDPMLANFDKDECRSTYRNFDRIVCVSDACSDKFKEFLPEYADRVVTVYNFFPIDDIKHMAEGKITQKSTEKIHIVTVSRIDNSQKRLNLIPEIADKLIKSNIKNFTWTLVGDGPDLHSLKKRVHDLGLQEYLIFTGNKLNPYPYIKDSSLLALVSGFEGYPMVICEALILGIPVLTTNFAAAQEQILNGKNGIIVGMDIDEIYNNIANILKSKSWIQRMKNYIAQNPYTNDIAIKQLNCLIYMEDENEKKYSIMHCC